MAPDDRSARTRERSPEQRARPTVSWRFVLAALLITFFAMMGSIYWVVRTGKL
jgi:hypothetical protein